MLAVTARVPEQVPDLVAALAGDRTVDGVWTNGIGGTTWRLGRAEDTTYLKVGPIHPEFDPVRDAARYEWLASYVPVPVPLGVGELDGWGWFESAPVPGWMAVDGFGGPAPRFADRVGETIRALGAALRHFHDTVPVDDCPFTWSAEERLARLPPAAARRVGAVPHLDPVVCHGDACNPNTHLFDDLSVAGFVDLARSGVADRWADLAPASMSVGWNFGGGLEHLLLEGYGIGRDIPMDAVKLDWYSRLWDAGGVPPAPQSP